MQASQGLDTELKIIDLHFNSNLSPPVANLSTDVIFPPAVNTFSRERNISSGNTYSPCNESAQYEQARYKTTQNRTVILTVYYCLDKQMIVTPKVTAMPQGCGDMLGFLHLRESVQTQYIYGTCSAMFTGAEGFAGTITWANGGFIFSLYGSSQEIAQFLHDYPY
jgi:hypothetical protein